MSISNENSDNTSQQTVETSLPQEKSVICDICAETIANTDERLRCSNKECEAWTCANCTKTMIEIMLGEPTLNYPLKCGACEQEFDQIHVEEMIIKSKYYEQYIACILPIYWSDECLEENEQWAQCKCQTNSELYNNLAFLHYYRSILSIS